MFWWSSPRLGYFPLVTHTCLSIGRKTTSRSLVRVCADRGGSPEFQSFRGQQSKLLEVIKINIFVISKNKKENSIF